VNNVITAAFVNYAASILGDTNHGLSGPKIVEITTKHAVDAGIPLPYSSYPPASGGVNKRTMLERNLNAFEDEYRYKIIHEMCDRFAFFSPNKEKIDELKAKLTNLYGQFFPDPYLDNFDNAVVEETKHWLKSFPESLESYDMALKMRLRGEYTRSSLDNLRFSLEMLLKKVLANNMPIEKQISQIGTFLKINGGSPQLTNMFLKILDYYSLYQNEFVKHNDAVKKQEVEFIFEITSCFMRHIVRVHLLNTST
jgi:hypothetical protein